MQKNLNKILERGFFIYTSKESLGEALIIIKFDKEKIDALKLILGSTENIQFSLETFNNMLDDEIIEKADTVPKDIFSNFE